MNVCSNCGLSVYSGVWNDFGRCPSCGSTEYKQQEAGPFYGG